MLRLHVRRHAGSQERADRDAESRHGAPTSRDLVARFEGLADVYRHSAILNDESEIAPAIDSRSVLMVLHIQPDFSRNVAPAGRPACS